MENPNPDSLSPLLLAYLGDSVMEVMVRERLVLAPGADPAGCNRRALKFVTASAQAQAARRVKEILDPEEESLFIRAKNARAPSAPSNVDLYSYRLATALEALFGWHLLRGEAERLGQLLEAAYPQLKAEPER
ncbi:MAG: ribonuclease III [Clostridia bacterium]|nr:ribonuclease III [Clostridia bacterium]